MTQNENFVYIHKTCIGHLVVQLTHPITGAKQKLVFEAAQTKKILPLEWAALVYADTSSGAYNLFKKGYFTFSDNEKVRDYALEHNLLIGDVDLSDLVVKDANHLEEVLATLKSGKKTRIDELLKNQKTAEDVVRVARENVESLTQGILDYIEKKLGIALTDQSLED